MSQESIDQEQFYEIKFKVANLEEDMKEARMTQQDMHITISELSKVISEINSKLDKQKSFIGGIIFVVSAAWAVVVTFKDAIRSALGH